MTTALRKTLVKVWFASTAIVMTTAAQSVLAKPSQHCTAIAETAQQAADRADWVIEGDVTNALFWNTPDLGRWQTLSYMQAADQARPALGVPRRHYVDAKHAPIVTAEGPDGWWQVRSTQGAFSIELPGDVTDITKGSSAQPAFLLRAKDRSGTAFIAVFERAGPGAELAGTHDEAGDPLNGFVRRS